MAAEKPKIMNPLWMAADLADLENNLALKFYSVHDRVINFIIPSKTNLLMIASSELERGPSSIGLSIRDFIFLKSFLQQKYFRGLILRDFVKFSANKETVFINRCGGEVVSFAPVSNLYENKETVYHAAKYYKNELINKVGNLPDSSALSLFNIPGGEAYFRKRIRVAFPVLTKSLIKRDISLFSAKAPDLAGLGRGFSPEGDDLLYGALLAHHYFDYDPLFIEELQNQSAFLLKSTNLMGAHLITMGFKGLAAAPVIKFNRALAEGLEKDSTLDAVLSIGHSTGIAIIVAILYYLDILDRQI